jgi:uncharacterized protein
MQAQGRDRRGQGGAKATIVSKLTPGESGPDTTRVEVVTDYHITGRLARFGRGGMIEDISNRLLGEFAKCLQTSLAGDGSSAGVAAGGAEAAAVPDTAETSTPESGSEAVADAVAAGAAPAGAETIAAEGPAAGAAPVAEAEPVEGLSLMVSVLWNQAKHNPAPIAAVIFGFLLALRVFRRRD